MSTHLEEPGRLETINKFGRVAETAVQLGREFGDCSLPVEAGERADLPFGEHLLRNYESIIKKFRYLATRRVGFRWDGLVGYIPQLPPTGIGIAGTPTEETAPFTARRMSVPGV
jgi:hypothetical protein